MSNTKSTPAAAGRVTRDAGAAKAEESKAADAKVTADAKPAEPVDYPGLRGTDAEVAAEPVDDRDATIAKLRAELAAIRAQPDGAATEMQRALAALTAEVERMKAGDGLVPVPVAEDPDPFLYNVVLACGDRFDGQHPHATAHFCGEHGTQRVDRVFPKSPEQLAEQIATAGKK